MVFLLTTKSSGISESKSIVALLKMNGLTASYQLLWWAICLLNLIKSVMIENISFSAFVTKF